MKTLDRWKIILRSDEDPDTFQPPPIDLRAWLHIHGATAWRKVSQTADSVTLECYTE